MRRLAHRIFVVWIIACGLVLIPAYSCGQYQEHEAEEHNGEEHARHNHHLALFVGATSKFEKNETDFTLGIDYEYLLDKTGGRWKIGLTGELIFAHKTEYLLAIPLIYQITDALYFLAGPGVEWHHTGEEEEHNGHHIIEEANECCGIEAELFFRIGIGYAIEAGTIVIAPILNVDFFGSHTALVWGVSFGKGF